MGVLTALLVLVGCSEAAVAPEPPSARSERRLVAHALGAPSDSHRTYCNCREGFEASYAAGFRYFEADVILASDGVPFAYHGGFPERLGFTSDASLIHSTSTRLKPRRIDGRYRPLDGYGLLGLLREHPDATLLIHTKLGSYTETPLWLMRRLHGKEKERLVSYVWFDDQIADLRAAGARRFVVPMHEHLGMTLEATLAFVRKHHLDSVLGSAGVFTPDAVESLRHAGVRHFYADRGYRKALAPLDEEQRILTARMKWGLHVYSDRWFAAD